MSSTVAFAIFTPPPAIITGFSAADIKLAAEHIIRTWDRLYKILAKHSWKTVEQVEKDCDRDNFMTAEEALEYWLIDKIISKK